jgi:hypothetical protein
MHFRRETPLPSGITRHRPAELIRDAIDAAEYAMPLMPIETPMGLDERVCVQDETHSHPIMKCQSKALGKPIECIATEPSRKKYFTSQNIAAFTASAPCQSRSSTSFSTPPPAIPSPSTTSTASPAATEVIPAKKNGCAAELHANQSSLTSRRVLAIAAVILARAYQAPRWMR